MNKIICNFFHLSNFICLIFYSFEWNQRHDTFYTWICFWKIKQKKRENCWRQHSWRNSSTSRCYIIHDYRFSSHHPSMIFMVQIWKIRNFFFILFIFLSLIHSKKKLLFFWTSLLVWRRKSLTFCCCLSCLKRKWNLFSLFKRFLWEKFFIENRITSCAKQLFPILALVSYSIRIKGASIQR